MAKKRSKKQQQEYRSKLLGIVAAVLCVIASLILGQDRVDEILDTLFQETGMTSAPVQVDGELKVHFIDVGQGDCTLIQTASQNILVDAGERGNGNTILSYLESQHVEELDLVVATHPHSDHIGSMPDILKALPVKKVLEGNVPEKLIPTTRIYESLLDIIAEKDIPLIEAAPGLEYDIGGGAKISVLGPASDNIKDLNNTSAVFRLEYGETSFMFTGDAEKESEEEILAHTSKKQLHANVLKLGHHGSRTSNSQEWLYAVAPEYAVALVGKDNDYGHPHEETLKKLKKAGITLYRSDVHGTIVFGSDGKSLTVITEKGAA